jgi:hypothetical protein
VLVTSTNDEQHSPPAILNRELESWKYIGSSSKQDTCSRGTAPNDIVDSGRLEGVGEWALGRGHFRSGGRWIQKGRNGVGIE